MPLKVDTVQKLLNYGESRGIRPMNEDETPAQYREMCAVLIEKTDSCEAMELREKKGWDEIDPNIALIHMLTSNRKD